MNGPRLLGEHEPRVVEIKADNRTTRSRHTLSGYLVDDELVLTCGHDVVGADAVRVRQILAEDFTEAELIWPDPDEPGLDRSLVDVALLRVPGLAAPTGRVIWGELTGFDSEEPARCIGFPKADQRGSEYPPALVTGTVVPSEAAGQDRMKFTVPGLEPVEPTGWTGLSGAMLLSERCLLGVAAELDPGREQVIDVIPTRVILDQPRLAALLGDPEVHGIAAGHPLIRDPFEQIGVETDFKLITARYGQVPFVSESHGDDLEALLRWCEEDDGGGDVSIRVLTGPAGSGKTRLAAELCQRLPQRSSEWSAGFAVDDQDKPWGSFYPRTPLLIVFDYVERPAVTARVIDFLQHLERLGDALQCPVRALLVSRATGGWYEQIRDHGGGFLHQRLRDEGDSVRLALSRDAFDQSRRRAHFIAAFERFTKDRRDAPEAADLLDQIDDHQYDSPLLVHIAALLAARGETLPKPGPSGLRERLLDHLLRRERTKRWIAEPGLSTTNVSPAQCDQALHAVAIMTMTLPTAKEATGLLKASELWSDQSNASRRESANALVRLYPESEDGRSRRAGAIEPDLISEHLLVSVDDLDGILTQLLSFDLEPTHYSRLVHLLSLTCDHYPDTIDRFQQALSITLAGIAGDDTPGISTAEVLDLNLNRLIGIARNEVAGSDTPRVTSMLTTLLEQQSNDPRVAEIVAGADIEASLDEPRLAPLSKALHSLQIQYFRRAGKSRELIGALEGLAESLLVLDSGQAALAALQGAKGLREELGDFEPESSERHLIVLRRLRDSLLADGRFEAAVKAADQIAETRWRTGERRIAAYEDSLSAWFEAGVALRRARDPKAALAVVLHAVRFRRELGMVRKADYADSIRELEHLATALTDLDRRRDAREAALEAVRLRRLIGEVDRAKYEESFKYLDNAHAGSDEYKIETIRELLEIKRWLAEIDDSSKTGLAESLERYGNQLWVRHQYPDALEMFAEAVAIRKELASDVGSRIMLAKAMADLGIGQWLEALRDPAVGSLQHLGEVWLEVAHEVTDYWPSAVRALQEYAMALWMSDHRTRALEVMAEAADHERGLELFGNALSPWQLQDLDTKRLGDRESLIKLDLKAEMLEQIDREHPIPHLSLVETLEHLARQYIHQDRHESAAAALARAIEIRGQLVSSHPALHWESIGLDTKDMVESLVAIGESEQALDAVEEWGAKLQTLLDNDVHLAVDVADAWAWLNGLRDSIIEAKRRSEVDEGGATAAG